MKKIILLLIIILNFEYCYADNKIVYIDINNILNNSIVGKSISKHLQNIRENKSKEFKLIEKRLLDKEKDIIKKKNILEKNIYEEQVVLLNKEVSEYNLKKKNFNKEIEEKKIKYTKAVLNSLNSIVSKYVEENSISIVLPKKNLIIAKKDLDITNIIMNLLNNDLKEIAF
tara:strand:+ start:350 stop:862 length:513 start_codon:yes stop_codon:yes gene_type:complete